MNKEGKRIRTIKKSDHNFSLNVGVAVDKEDNINFISLTGRKIAFTSVIGQWEIFRREYFFRFRCSNYWR